MRKKDTKGLNKRQKFNLDKKIEKDKKIDGKKSKNFLNNLISIFATQVD